MVRIRLARGSRGALRPADESAPLAAAFRYPWRRVALGMGAIVAAAVLAASIGAVGIPPSGVLTVVVSRLPAPLRRALGALLSLAGERRAAARGGLNQNLCVNQR